MRYFLLGQVSDSYLSQRSISFVKTRSSRVNGQSIYMREANATSTCTVETFPNFYSTSLKHFVLFPFPKNQLFSSTIQGFLLPIHFWGMKEKVWKMFHCAGHIRIKLYAKRLGKFSNLQLLMGIMSLTPWNHLSAGATFIL